MASKQEIVNKPIGTCYGLFVQQHRVPSLTHRTEPHWVVSLPLPAACWPCIHLLSITHALVRKRIQFTK